MEALGISLFSAPLVFDATAPVAAAWTAWVGGGLLAIFGAGSLIARLSNAALRHGDAVTGVLTYSPETWLASARVAACSGRASAWNRIEGLIRPASVAP